MQQKAAGRVINSLILWAKETKMKRNRIFEKKKKKRKKEKAAAARAEKAEIIPSY